MIENWKAVVGFEGIYEVSDLGNVRSVDRAVEYWSEAAGRNVKLRYKSQPIRQRIEYERGDRGGTPKRLGVKITDKNGHAKQRLVHRLVLEAFIGPCPKNMECSHLNGCGTDNRLQNLAYEDHKTNCGHRRSHGTEGIGSKNNQAKLTEQKVRTIRALKNTYTVTRMAEMFGVHRGTIWHINSRNTWTHV